MKPLKSRLESEKSAHRPTPPETSTKLLAGDPARVTLRDIAEKVGLSDATVSLALREHPRISAATRRRVRAAADALGYRSDPALARLMTYLRTRRLPREDGVIAVISAFEDPQPWKTNPHLQRLRTGMLARTGTLGFELTDFWLGERGMTPRRLGGILRARSVAGVVFLGFPHATPTLDFPWESFACTTIGHSLGVPLHRVCQHHYAELGLALASLAAHGYRRPGLVLNADVDQRVQRYYRAAFHVAPGNNENAAPEAFLWPETGTESSRMEALLDWYVRERPDVLLVSQPPPDVLAVADAVRRSLRQRQPPAFALLDLHERDRGRMAGIRHAYEDLGGAAVDVVVGQLIRGESGRPSRPSTVMIAGEWHDGASAPPRGRLNPRVTAARA